MINRAVNYLINMDVDLADAWNERQMCFLSSGFDLVS